MKLNAKQIGTLARICEKIAAKFPPHKPDEPKVGMQVDKVSPDFHMEGWERALKKKINSTKSLPKYDEKDSSSSLSDWVDKFMNYF
jgi:hypothetical protein